MGHKINCEFYDAETCYNPVRKGWIFNPLCKLVTDQGRDKNGHKISGCNLQKETPKPNIRVPSQGPRKSK